MNNFRHVNSASPSYIAWNIDLNWLTFLEAIKKIKWFLISIQNYETSWLSVENMSHLSHERFEINGVRLANDPVSVTTQSPTSDRPNQSFFLWQARHQVRHKIREMDGYATHTTYNKVLLRNQKNTFHR